MRDRSAQLPLDPDASAAPGRPVHRQLSLLLLVAGGGGLGALARYGLLRALPPPADGFPTATFVTNVAGAFALGLLLQVLARSGPDTGRRRALRLGLGTGVLGAFTTYSTLAVEVTLLGRDGHVGLGLLYGLLSAGAGVLAAALGITAGGRAP